jgi:hypothetical protein
MKPGEHGSAFVRNGFIWREGAGARACDEAPAKRDETKRNETKPATSLAKL